MTAVVPPPPPTLPGQGDLIETQNFKKLVGLVDKMRDIGLSDHISMPRIAVLGSQSSGKSSLLESIVGMNFLPRGSGVVTRRPLELRLSRVRDMKEPPYGVFAAEADKKYTSFVEIRKRIEYFTDQLCGANKNIKDDPIVLRIYSANCPDLTVIDLPGITRIPIGDQDKNIEKITKGLVTKYCKDERTIILCVIPANADMTTSESLQLAMELDPSGVRTVGVITKIDIMDKGTDAKKMLLNKEVELKMGYIGVKGRSQEDVNNNMTVTDALKDEMNFFASHNIYRHLPKELLGTQNLVKKLTSVMYDHMRRVLPKIMKEIEFKISSTEKNIASLGTPIPEDHREKLDQIWREISLFYDKFKAHVKGEYAEVFTQSQKGEAVLASAQINILFNNLYKTQLLKIKYSDVFSDSEIIKTVDMYSGNTLPGFVRVDCFIALLNPLLEGLRAPALDLIDKVYMILKTVGSHLMTETFSKVFSIKEILLDLFDKILSDCRESTDDFINRFLDCEARVIFTKDPNFITNAHSWPDDVQKSNPDEAASNRLNQASGANPTPTPNRLANSTVSQNPTAQNPPTNPQSTTASTSASQVSTGNVPNGAPQKDAGDKKLDPKEKTTLDAKERKVFLIKEMRKRIDQYFQINVKLIGDSVPKIVSNFLINDLLDKIYFMMFRKVADPIVLNDIREPDHIVQQRKNLMATLEVLNTSKKILLKDPDLNIGIGDGE